MFEASDIREWRDHDVVDAEGHKIGELEAVYVDTVSDQPSFRTVTVGLPTRHRLVFVPLDHATVDPGYVKVTYEKAGKGRPLDRHRRRVARRRRRGDLQALRTGLAYQPGTHGERRLARR